jgi:hypothetical protein
VVSSTPRPLYPWERPSTQFTGSWVRPRAGLEVCEKSHPHWVQSLDHPTRSQSLCRLSYPAHHNGSTYKISPCQSQGSNVGGVAGVRGRQNIYHTDKMGFFHSFLQCRMLTVKGQILPGREACQIDGN